MKLYIANCTLQNHVFNYRPIENKNPRSQPINAGRQIQIAGDLNMPEVENIVKQSHKYGLRTVEEARRLDATIPIVFIASVDKLVSETLMRDVIAHNRSVLTVRGKKMRELAAMASSVNMAEKAHTPNAANKLEISLEEQTNSTLDQPDDNLLGEGWALPGASTAAATSTESNRGGRRGRRR